MERGNGSFAHLYKSSPRSLLTPKLEQKNTYQPQLLLLFTEPAVVILSPTHTLYMALLLIFDFEVSPSANCLFLLSD